MKKYIFIILSTMCMLLFIGCGHKEKYEIGILVPAGSTEAFVYSDEEIRPTGNKITIWSGAGLGDTEVILKPVNENVETGYVATYLTHSMPVEFDTHNVKDEWFVIGVSEQNDSDRFPIAVSVEVEGVEVRTADKAEVTFQATILEIKDTCYLVEPVEGSQELKSADKITVPIKKLDQSLEPEVGDVIEIKYNGEIAESYPAQITEVYDIKVMKEAEKLLLDKENFIFIIDELTNKVSVFYEEMKKSVENVSPYRWELLNRMADRSLRV